MRSLRKKNSQQFYELLIVFMIGGNKNPLMIADQVFLYENSGIGKLISKSFRNHDMINIILDFRSNIY